jgi:hypothetical protein
MSTRMLHKTETFKLTRRWGAQDKRKLERRMLQAHWLEYC